MRQERFTIYEPRRSAHVLVTRVPDDTERFPRSIILGVDGSRQSLDAATVAAELHGRFGAPTRMIVARGGKETNTDGLRQLGLGDSELEWDERRPLEALTAAIGPSDLLVLGSRGLHGLRALGSVSERSPLCQARVGRCWCCFYWAWGGGEVGVVS